MVGCAGGLAHQAASIPEAVNGRVELPVDSREPVDVALGDDDVGVVHEPVDGGEGGGGGGGGGFGHDLVEP
jgi:hypothetical protein